MSASLPSASRVSAGRMLIIGVVALLAIGIGVAAGTVLLAGRAAAVGAGAAYVAPDVPVYYEIRLEPSAAQDASLRELLGRFPPIEDVDLDQPLYGQLTERLDELLATENVGVSWREDVAPWFDGHVAFALNELPAGAFVPIDPMMVPAVPSFVTFFGVTDAAAAEAGIGRLLAASPEEMTFTETEHAGVTIHVAEGSDAGAYAITADQVLIAANADDIREALDIHAAGSGTLSESDDMSGLVGALPADWLMFTMYDLTDAMAEAIGASASASPAITDAFEELLAGQSFRGAAAVSASGNRVLYDVAIEPLSGPFAMKNDDRSLAGEIPADALFFSESGNVGPALTAVVDAISEAIAAAPGGEEGLRDVEGALGADLSELVSWIGDGAVAIGMDGAEAYAGILVVPTDVDQARRRLDQLVTFARLAASDPSTGLTVEETEVAGTTVTTIRWEPETGTTPDPFMPVPTGAVVQLAVTDDRVIIGTGESFVARVLGLDPADGLASEPRYADAIGELGGTTNAAVTWLDLTATREAIEAVAEPMLGMMDPEDVYTSEIRPWLLPLDRLAAVTRLDGAALVIRSALFVE